MIYMSGAPIPTALGDQTMFAGNSPSPNQPAPGSTCGTDPNQGNQHGFISGPSGATPPAAAGAGGPPGGPGAFRPPQLTDQQRAERDNMPGFMKTDRKSVV